MLSFIVDFTPTKTEEYALRREQLKIRLALINAGIYDLTIHMQRGVEKRFQLEFEGTEEAFRAARAILQDADQN